MTTAKQSVLVTGGSGFIAAHIVSQLVQLGFQVTATVRSADQAGRLLEINPHWIDMVQFVYVPDMRNSDAFVHAFDKAHDFVIHTASPVTFEVRDIQKDLVEPAVQGTLSLLESAHKLGGSRLKRVLVLGSAVAVLNSFKEATGVPGRDYDEEDWNPVTVEDAAKHQDAVLGYNASKKMAEKAAWGFIEEHKPAFDLTVLNPDIVIGPMIHPVRGPAFVNESNRFVIYNFMDGTYKAVEAVKYPFYHFVDVRDVAKAHILAMTAPKASNKRIILVSDLLTPQFVVNIVHKHFPNLADRVGKGDPSQILPRGVNPNGWNVARSLDVFGKDWRYRSLEESVKDTVESLLRYEEGWNLQAEVTARRE